MTSGKATIYGGYNTARYYFLPDDLDIINKKIPHPTQACGPGPCLDINVPKDNFSTRMQENEKN